jgi:hypothetical protein
MSLTDPEELEKSLFVRMLEDAFVELGAKLCGLDREELIEHRAPIGHIRKRMRFFENRVNSISKR